jgi:hypothetical protein
MVSCGFVSTSIGISSGVLLFFLKTIDAIDHIVIKVEKPMAENSSPCLVNQKMSDRSEIHCEDICTIPGGIILDAFRDKYTLIHIFP